MKQTPLKDQDNKIDIIEHINQDHTDEVLTIAQVYADSPDAVDATLHDVFDEGLEIRVCFAGGGEKLVYAAFQMQGDTEEKLLYLAYAAMARQGLALSDNRRQFFEVIDTQMRTPNMLRLTVSCETPLPENAPAYAYGFLLKTLENLPEEKPMPEKPITRWQKLMNRFMLWIMKKLSSKNRQKMFKSMNKGIRYYTLQSTWKSDATRDFADRGYVDVFLHGDTPGSAWAKALKSGDVIMSRLEHEDKHENLSDGQALLIADETAYPALLGFLQCWENPVKPFVIILSTHANEQDYFSDEDLMNAARVKRIICQPNEQGAHVIEALTDLPTFTTAWGAFEQDSAKAVRMNLRKVLKISGQDNRIKGYWALKTKE